MSIYVGTSEIKNIYVGTTPVKEVYVGTTKVRPAGWTPTSDVIAYYPLNDNLNDIKNGYNLTAANGAAITTLNGVKCLNLTPSSSYAYRSSPFQTGGNNRTHFMWVYWTALGMKPVYSYGTTGSGRADVIYANNVDNQGIGRSQYGYALKSGTNPTINAWHCVVVTIKNGGQVMYVDGTQKNSSSWGVSTASGSTFYLGHCTWDGTYMGGYIGEWGSTNTIWTSAQVTAYYNATKSNYGL